MNTDPKSRNGARKTEIIVLPGVKGTVNIDSKDFADVGKRLIDKVSSALGKAYEPIHIRRIAAAKASALITEAETNVTLSEIEQRAIARVHRQEVRKQENLERTIEEAMPLLEPNAAPEDVDDDWINEWVERASMISETTLQSLWARILAGEANSRGSFRKSVLHTVSMLEKEDVISFGNLCRFVVTIGAPIPLVHDPNDEIYTKNGISFTSIQLLIEAGLISHHVVGIVRQGVPEAFEISYGNEILQVKLRKGASKIGIGHVNFTTVGLQLFSLSDVQTIPEFPQYISDKYAEHGVQVVGPSIRGGSDEP